MKWIKGLPEVAGVYWYIDKEEDIPVLMFVTTGVNLLTNKKFVTYSVHDYAPEYTGEFLLELNSKFYGPITPPEVEEG